MDYDVTATIMVICAASVVLASVVLALTMVVVI
jgi:hypothetical protein